MTSQLKDWVKTVLVVISDTLPQCTHHCNHKRFNFPQLLRRTMANFMASKVDLIPRIM